MIHSIVLGALLCVLSTGGQATPVSQTSPADKPAVVKVPDTAAGKALSEFVETFNAGGEKRKVWLETRTTLDTEQASGILQQDTDFLAEYGPVTIVRVPEATTTRIEAILRHAKSGAHGHLTIDVEAEAPHKVANMQLRGATPEEIKGK